MDFAELELITLRDVWFARMRRPGVSDDFHLRRILREYSQKFHTPLHEVWDLPLEFVVRAWFEDLYEDWKDEEILREVKKLTTPVEKLMEERRREDANDADMWMFQKDIERSEGAAKKLEEAVKNLGEAVEMFRQPAQRPMTHEERLIGARLSKPVELVNTKVVPGEKLTIKFENIDLDAIDGFGLLDDPKSK